MTAFMENTDVGIVHPGNMAVYYKLPVAYQGFCPYSLLNRGILVPGTKNIGLVRYKDTLYCFENLKNALMFMDDADLYFRKVNARNIKAMVEFCKSNPEYIQLLRMEGSFPTVEALEQVMPLLNHSVQIILQESRSGRGQNMY